MSDIKLGKYRHFQGKLYKVIGISKHTGTLEELVVYEALFHSEMFGDNALWVRPRKSFFEIVLNGNGKRVPRFEYVGPIDKDCGDKTEDIATPMRD